MVDVFPTLLEAIGYSPSRSRAGLGVSLLSNRDTLVERHGIEGINARLRAETALQQRLWEGLAPQQSSSPDGLPERASQTLETPQDTPEEHPIVH